MSKLLEIFGKAITVDTADLIWHWLNAIRVFDENTNDPAATEFAEILELMGNMELERAEEKIKFYLYEHEDCTFGRMAAVAICLHKNNVSEAIEQLQSIYMRQPSNTMALYALGYCFERTGHEAEAIEFYQDCLKFKGHLQLPRQRKAAIYYKSGRLEKTIQQYEMLTTEHPEDIGSQVLLGYLYLDAQKYDDAIETFNTAILAHPDNFNDTNHDVELEQLEQTGDFDRAIEQIQDQMEQVGEMPDLEVRLADILSKAGRPAEAIVHYENALRNQPNFLEATIKLGTHYLRFQRPALAAEQFNRAIELNDEIVDAYIGLAIAQEHAELSDESYRTLSLASAIQQNSTLLFSQTAILHLQSVLNQDAKQEEMNGFAGIEDDDQPQAPKSVHIELDDVIKTHQAQLAVTPKSPDIHYRYGMLMMARGDMLQEAVSAFDRALELNPTHHRVRCKLSLCLYETGHHKMAMQKLMESTDLDSATLELHYKTALLYCDRRKFAEALFNLENTMRDNFTEPDAITNIEVVLENLGLIERANATWDRLSETARHALGLKK